MSDSRQQRSHSPISPDDGVRVIVRNKTAAPRGRVLPVAALLALGGFVYLLIDSVITDSPEVTPVPVVQVSLPASGHADAEPGRQAATAIADAPTAPVKDAGKPGYSDDLASYFRPGDPEPTGAELIKALNDAGVYTGIGAFNPPGTSPPLAGLAVPEDFELPEGFVRHHQVTDEGEPLEPILMFSPDIEYYEAAGNVPVPEDRIVTVELAPPGMPIRDMIPPPPR